MSCAIHAYNSRIANWAILVMTAILRERKLHFIPLPPFKQEVLKILSPRAFLMTFYRFELFLVLQIIAGMTFYMSTVILVERSFHNVRSVLSTFVYSSC